ncbi:YchJ family protein [Microbacterium nymphoidis]|uniref:YchJ family protein n=2 Tax=Microbacterium TaxID=33882 RepID=UPI001E49CB4E|nr:YchJ family metal-binding protein [Microbacterium nymphoidis]MCD2497724.1 hypothetical protein [Microbacterium nymphoidis]
MAMCLCGSGAEASSCCSRFLDGDAVPASPEQLMRSRYTAFARGDARYLMSTWHPGTAPAELSLDDATQWLGLEILDAPPVADDAKRGVVEFVARYRESSGTRGRIHERSRFVRQSGRWWYLDGVHS